MHAWYSQAGRGTILTNFPALVLAGHVLVMGAFSTFVPFPLHWKVGEDCSHLDPKDLTPHHIFTQQIKVCEVLIQLLQSHHTCSIY